MTFTLQQPTETTASRQVVNFRRPEIPHGLNGHGPFRAVLCSAARRLALRCSVPFQRWLSRPADGAFGILMYHRVTPIVPGLPSPTWNVTPERFRRQLLGLLRRGFQPWPLREVLHHAAEQRRLPPKTFVVTFDDGYANNYLNAWPILKALNVPATIFLATAYLDSESPFPCDDWSAAHVTGGTRPARTYREAWVPLTTAQCREMQQDGLVELGAHTHTHADFRNRPDALQRDLSDCLAVLKERFEIGDATFAFPYGTKRLGFSGPALAAVARNAGLLCSLTTESELVRPNRSPFDWGRFTAEQNDTPATLAAKLSGCYERLRETWQRVRGR